MMVLLLFMKDYNFFKQEATIKQTIMPLTIRLLSACTSRVSTKLLWLAAARICHQESTVIVQKNLLDLALGSLVHN
jgi:hypothetical protein